MSTNLQSCCLIATFQHYPGARFVVGDGSAADVDYQNCLASPGAYGCNDNGPGMPVGPPAPTPSSPAPAAPATGALTFTGPVIKELLIGFAVLVVLTLLLPPKFGVWLPFLILLGYAALHQQTVLNTLNSLLAPITGAGGTNR